MTAWPDAVVRTESGTAHAANQNAVHTALDACLTSTASQIGLFKGDPTLTSESDCLRLTLSSSGAARSPLGLSSQLQSQLFHCVLSRGIYARTERKTAAAPCRRHFSQIFR